MDSERTTTSDHPDYGLSFTDAIRDCLNPAVITVNQKGCVTSFNPQAEQLTRVAAVKMLKKPMKALPRPLREFIEEAFKARKPVDRRELSLSGRTVSASAFTAGARAQAVTIILNDLSPMQGLERNMRQLDRLASVGALSANMAHEIKNALVAVRTFVEMLVKENKSAELAELAGKELRRIDSIVSQMLRLAGPTKPSFGSVRIHTLLDHALALVQPEADAKKLKTRHEFEARADTVHGDEYQLQQAFLNLFFNAIEAMSPGGELHVTTEMGPKSILVSVKDTGSGVRPENLGKVFDPFFTTKKHGTGLGLPITRRIIEEHKGGINVVSEPNKGTTFLVRLPL
jgi:signal transduction histidine kinase